MPLKAVWYATGTNVAVAADTARRIIHVRLDVLSERPEERSGFRHPNLLGWVDENRPRLLSAALTILSAYARAGRPSQGLTSYGSFEGWSDLVRQAIVWVGLPDPCLTRTKLAETSDVTTDVLGQLVDAWLEYSPSGTGHIISRLLEELYRFPEPEDAAAVGLRAALEDLTNCPSGKIPAARQVANRLKSYRRRVVKGHYFDVDGECGRKEGRTWKLVRTPEPA